MTRDTTLVATIAVGLAVAFLLGFAATRLARDEEAVALQSGSGRLGEARQRQFGEES